MHSQRYAIQNSRGLLLHSVLDYFSEYQLLNRQYYMQYYTRKFASKHNASLALNQLHQRYDKFADASVISIEEWQLCLTATKI